MDLAFLEKIHPLLYKILFLSIYILLLHKNNSPPASSGELNFQPNHLYTAYWSAVNFQPDHLYTTYRSVVNFLIYYMTVFIIPAHFLNIVYHKLKKTSIVLFLLLPKSPLLWLIILGFFLRFF